jgi:predicted nucleic acid-binding protein
MVPAPFIVVVDANVLFPLTLRDTVLRAAAHDFFQLRWTKDILDEMERNLAKTGTTTAEKAAKLRAQMERFFPEAMVAGYETLIPAMQNDAKDRHVVAAAVKAGAQVVMTSNLKDFRPLPDGIEAQSPDEFLCNLFDLDPKGFVEMLREQAGDLQRPPVTFEALLDRLTYIVPELIMAVREQLGAVRSRPPANLLGEA